MRFTRLVLQRGLAVLTCTLASTLACTDDTTSTEEVGDTSSSESESESDSSSSESESDTSESDSSSSESDSTTSESDSSSSESDSTSDSTDTGGGMCNADDVIDVDIALSLVGSQAPAEGCEDFVFTGTLEGGGGSVWHLDACPCGALCLIPDPYTLTLTLPDPAMLPNVPTCPKIELRRDDACEVVSITISDLGQAEQPVWIGSREDVAPATIAELDVASQLFGVCECPDCDPPTLYELEFDWLGATLLLGEGEQGVLPAEGGEWDVASFNSHTRELAGTEHWAWAMKR